MAENINIPSATNNLRNALVDTLTSKNMDMRMRRVIDASPAQDANDYVILQQLTDAQATLQKEIDANSTDITTLKNQIKGTGTNTLHYIQATGSLTLTTTPTNVPGLSLTIDKIGTWLIVATSGFYHVGNESTASLVAQINMDGGGIGPAMYWEVPVVTGQTVTSSGCNVCTLTSYVATTQPHTATVQAYKTGGTGTSYIGTPSTLSALWISS